MLNYLLPSDTNKPDCRYLLLPRSQYKSAPAFISIPDNCRWRVRHKFNNVNASYCTEPTPEVGWIYFLHFGLARRIFRCSMPSNIQTRVTLDLQRCSLQKYLLFTEHDQLGIQSVSQRGLVRRILKSTWLFVRKICMLRYWLMTNSMKLFSNLTHFQLYLKGTQTFLY